MHEPEAASPGRVDDLLARAIDAELAVQRELRDAIEGLNARVDHLEQTITSLRADIASQVELAARMGLGERLDALTGDLRRQINDLGRLIVNDLGRLPQIVREAVAAAPAPAGAPDPVVRAPDERDGAPAGPPSGAGGTGDVVDVRDGAPAADPVVAEARAALDLPYADGGSEERRTLFRRR